MRLLKIKHLRTRPYTPRTNGKAERFVQTSLREWAYARAYNTSDERAAELPVWLHRYNCHRPHGSLQSKPPITRLTQTEDNLLRLYSQSAVRLKGPLCKVETDDASFFHGCPLRCVGCDKHCRLGTLRCRQEGASTPSAPLRIAAHVRDPSLTNLSGEHRTKPVPPEPDGLVADVDPALGQEIFDVAQRQRVSHVHHHDQTDDLWRAVEISERIAHVPRLTQPGQPENLL